MKANKFEKENSIELPKGFHERPTLHQAKIKASLTKKNTLEKRIITWQEKRQHGAYRRQLIEINADMKESFGWLNKCFLDPVSEGYIMAATLSHLHSSVLIFTVKMKKPSHIMR